MGSFGSLLGRAIRISFWIAAATWISASAFAQVPYFVNVQPIAVCQGDFATCAQISEPNAAIGFADPSGVDITRAILNQAGIDVHYKSTQFYITSPDVTAPFNTLNLFQGNVPGQLASPDLQNLSFQKQVSQNTPPNPNPFNVPLSSDSHTLNLAFVTFLNPVDVTGVYYALSWIGNNGIAVDTATFGLQTGSTILGAVPDALAHEIVHNFGLDHTTHNDPQNPSNLMSAARIVPTIENAISSLGAGNGAGMTDQLNPDQIAQIIDPAGAGMLSNQFLNPIANVDTQISDPPKTPDHFSVSFKNAGRPGESLDKLTLTLPQGLNFDRDFDFVDGVRPTQVKINPSSCELGRNCLELDFAGGTFMFGDKLDYIIGVCQNNGRENSGEESEGRCRRTSLDTLAGGTYTYDFSDGYQTTSVLRLINTDLLDANSWTPDLTTPTGLDLSLFTPFFTGLPCVMQSGMTTCPELDLHADRYDLLIFEQTVPEPPSVPTILTGLGFWFVYNRAWRRGKAMLANSLGHRRMPGHLIVL